MCAALAPQPIDRTDRADTRHGLADRGRSERRALPLRDPKMTPDGR